MKDHLKVWGILHCTELLKASIGNGSQIFEAAQHARVLQAAAGILKAFWVTWFPTPKQMSNFQFSPLIKYVNFEFLLYKSNWESLI